MKTVQEQNKVIKAFVEPQEIDADAVYKKADFCVKTVVDGVCVVYNTLTGEICELSEREAELLCGGVRASEETRELIEHYFLVSEDFDEIELASEVYEFVKLFENKKGLTTYTIFTTMDCNARCFYCYEMGRPRTPMSEQTARDVVEFIKSSHAKGKRITLSWFGGEPLYNQSVIDIITDGVREAGIEFRSTMVSNGYLFDRETAKKARECWNLRSVQITLDGTEEVYNRSKAFIYGGESAFKIVTENIEGLLEEEIYVTVRLNFGEHNKEDLYTLVDWVNERYEKKDRLSVYAHLLFEYNADVVKDDYRNSLAGELIALEDRCREMGLRNDRVITNGLCKTHCMADSSTAVTITPTGKLGKCEHFTENNFVGDIYGGITDLEKIAEFKERSNTKEMCKGCSAYPVCIKLKMCPDLSRDGCTLAARKIAEEGLERRLSTTYKLLKKKENKAE